MGKIIMTPQQIAVILMLYAFVSTSLCIGGAVVGWNLLRPTIVISNNDYDIILRDNFLKSFKNNQFYDVSDVPEPFVFGENNVIFPRGWTEEEGNEWVAAHLNKSP